MIALKCKGQFTCSLVHFIWSAEAQYIQDLNSWILCVDLYFILGQKTLRRKHPYWLSCYKNLPKWSFLSQYNISFKICVLHSMVSFAIDLLECLMWKEIPQSILDPSRDHWHFPYTAHLAMGIVFDFCSFPSTVTLVNFSFTVWISDSF